MASPVVLHVYDLSQGMARAMSLPFLGVQIDAIYHTGIVVFGKEWFFGQGIMSDRPGMTPYGTPMEVVQLGTTSVTLPAFMEELRRLTGRFNAGTYNLLRNNCNNFSDAVARFLLGVGIPQHITGLPETAMNSPLGAMLLPMFERLEGQMAAHGQVFPGLAGGIHADPERGGGHQQQQQHGESAWPTLAGVAPHIHTAHPAIETVVGKLRQLAGEAWAVTDKQAAELAETIEHYIDHPTSADSTRGALRSDVYPAIAKVMAVLPDDKLFPAVDLMRMLAVLPGPNAHYREVARTQPEAPDSYLRLVGVAERAVAAGSDPVQHRGLHLTVLRLLANLFSHGDAKAVVPHDLLPSVVTYACDGLLHDPSVKLAAATLIFNLAPHLPNGGTDVDLQVVSALCHLLSEEADSLVIHRLLAALGRIMLRDPSARELATLLDFDPERFTKATDKDIAQVATEIVNMRRPKQ
jgi:hypothetical protein